MGLVLKCFCLQFYYVVCVGFDFGEMYGGFWYLVFDEVVFGDQFVGIDRIVIVCGDFGCGNFGYFCLYIGQVSQVEEVEIVVVVCVGMVEIFQCVVYQLVCVLFQFVVIFCQCIDEGLGCFVIVFGDEGVEFIYEGCDWVYVVYCQFVVYQVECLDVIGVFIDQGDVGIMKQLGCILFFGEVGFIMDLQIVGDYVIVFVGQIGFYNWGQQCYVVVVFFVCCGVIGFFFQIVVQSGLECEIV